MFCKIQLILLITLFSYMTSAQPVIGFWEIKEVKVGDKLMTPVARWTRINKDGTYQSGNGWHQNSEGTWQFNAEASTFFPSETNGIKEPFGAFHVSVNGKNMIWQRMEGGMNVKVTLAPINKLPKSTADQIVGLWDLTDALQEKQSIKAQFDPENKYYIFIRWDRVYVKRTSKGEQETGYWYINAHQPEVTFINENEKETHQRWRISVNNSELTLYGISESNKNTKLLFQRVNEFPE